MTVLRYILIFAFILLTNVTQAQEKQTDFDLNIKVVDKYVIISLELKNDTIIYWRNPGEIGVPTTFDFSNSSNLKEIKTHWPLPKLIQKEQISSYIYQDNIDFLFEFVPKNNKQPVLLKTEMSFVLCQKFCQNYKINLPEISSSQQDDTMLPKVLGALTKAPKSEYENFKIESISQELVENQHYLNIKIKAPKPALDPKIFFDLPEYIHFDPTKFEVISEENYQVVRLPFSFSNTKLQVIEDKSYINFVLDNGVILEYESVPQNTNLKADSFIWIIFCAFIGGLILNVMPCVLPILFLKTIQFIKLSEQNKTLIRKSFMTQAAGIIFSYLIFAITTYILQFLGHNVGLGMHFQQPIYLISMVLILSIISISLIFDFNFSLVLPNFIQNILNKNSNTTSLSGFFVSGVLTTFLAVPCTAPFVTIAVGFALTTNFIKMMIIFTVMGLGMSLPYLLLSTFPNVAKIIPKPGNWMIIFKKITGFIIFLTCFWLIYILSTQLGYRAALTLFLLIVLIKFVMFEKDILTKKSKTFILLVLFGLCYILPNNIYIQNVNHDTLVEKNWQEYMPQEIPSLIANDYIVLVDVSASWCATCSINKLTTLNNSTVLNSIKKYKLIAMRADISASTNEQVKNLMYLKHHRGIPLTIIYSKKYPQGLVLPTLLSPHILISNIKNATSLSN